MFHEKKYIKATLTIISTSDFLKFLDKLALKHKYAPVNSFRVSGFDEYLP